MVKAMQIARRSGRHTASGYSRTGALHCQLPARCRAWAAGQSSPSTRTRPRRPLWHAADALRLLPRPPWPRGTTADWVPAAGPIITGAPYGCQSHQRQTGRFAVAWPLECRRTATRQGGFVMVSFGQSGRWQRWAVRDGTAQAFGAEALPAAAESIAPTGLIDP